MSACFALVEAQASVLQLHQMIVLIRSFAAVTEDEVMRVPVCSADDFPCELVPRLHIRRETPGQITHAVACFVRNRSEERR